jgi:outer membrane protein
MTFCALVASLVLWGGAPKDAAAADAAPQRVVVVDIKEIIAKSVAGKAAVKNVEADVRAKEAGLEKRRLEINALRENLAKQGTLLSSEALEEKRVALQRKERELSEEVEVRREEVLKKNNIEISKVVEAIGRIVRDLAKNRNYAVVLESEPGFVVFASGRLDITDEVLKQLDSTTLNF